MPFKKHLLEVFTMDAWFCIGAEGDDFRELVLDNTFLKTKRPWTGPMFWWNLEEFCRSACVFKDYGPASGICSREAEGEILHEESL